MDNRQFFDALRFRLDKAEEVVHELDRRLAFRFNVLMYLRDDELGLSRIIADLLDPKASHGQGTLFLKLFLGMAGLKHGREWPEPGGSQIPVVVTRERRTSSGRNIDITVQIGSSNTNSYCLAIENKPYDDDRPNQVKDYLDYLKGEYCDRFLLIYIPPTGQGPSEKSITKRELEKWKKEFAIMPYQEDPEGPEDNFFDDYRIPHSLADWIKACRKNCEVDRLRWFLGDTIAFCQWKFGGQRMTTSPERDDTADFVLKNSSNLKTARAVYDSWPEVTKQVCEQFLKKLCSRIKTSVKEDATLKKFADDMKLGLYCNGIGRYQCGIWLYRHGWIPYQMQLTPDRPYSHSQTSILLENQSAGPNNWGIGVHSPLGESKMNGEDKNRRKLLNDKLADAFDHGKTDNCPVWLTLPRDKRDWAPRVLDLYQENENQGGEIMSYYVDRFTEIARKAMPIINDIEGPKGDN